MLMLTESKGLLFFSHREQEMFEECSSKIQNVIHIVNLKFTLCEVHMCANVFLKPA